MTTGFQQQQAPDYGVRKTCPLPHQVGRKADVSDAEPAIDPDRPAEARSFQVERPPKEG
ncbi:hypothetical protein [Caulobacter sp. CCUG 60055]|uniref:hypothetical protein n=1 Tax=Caulobacter sp. CCUG 60055 TaxID=2100090 RepID=UPI001FA7D49B|nr:hypothetical protein [Caulobacter sp. CCUG 60055]MBQ1542055.1 hypothetical protein [Caulobacteraceae bacterium]